MSQANGQPALSYEQSLKELEVILRELEDSSTTLEDSISRYERGIYLLQHCYGRLKDADLRIQKLAGVRADGTADLLPFDHIATAEKNKPKRKPTSKPDDEDD